MQVLDISIHVGNLPPADQNASDRKPQQVSKTQSFRTRCYFEPVFWHIQISSAHSGRSSDETKAFGVYVGRVARCDWNYRSAHRHPASSAQPGARAGQYGEVCFESEADLHPVAGLREHVPRL